MPQTAAATKTSLENAVENPKTKNIRQIVHVTLIFDGVEFTPVGLYEALDTKYGTVANERDAAAHGNYIYRVSA